METLHAITIGVRSRELGLLVVGNVVRAGLEARELFEERELRIADRAVPLPGDDEGGFTFGGFLSSSVSA